jgi:hypothetical protein
LVTWINIVLLERCLCLMRSTIADETTQTTKTISKSNCSDWVWVVLRFDMKWVAQTKDLRYKSVGSLLVRYSKYDLRESLMESASSPSPSRVDIPLGNGQMLVATQLTILLLHFGDLEA